jgi:biopolymer transport protein ExbB
MNMFGIEQSFSSWYGALIMAFIGGMSIYMAALAAVRFHFFRRIRADGAEALAEARQALAEDDAKALAKLKGQRASDPPIRILISAALSNRHMADADLRELLAVTQTRQRERLEKGLSAFGTMANIGPFLGLLGTVMGIIESFHNLAQTGAAGPNVVASGVAAALWGTAAGLVVAIPSVIAYNVFQKMARGITTEMEILSRELVLVLKSERASKLKVAVGA